MTTPAQHIHDSLNTGPLTHFDTAVLVVLGFSCLFAFFRGFVREILSLSFPARLSDR